MDQKIGRNSPCSCGSGKKYKKCCGSAAKKAQKIKVPEKAVAAFLDEGMHRVVFVTADMVVNQLRRTGPKIAESFDKSFDADVWEISEQFAQTFALLAHGYKRHVRRKIDSVGAKCGELLLNAAYTVIGALEILRHGFRLQPGILIRNEIETVCVALSLFAEPDLLVEWEKGRLESTKTISRAKKVLPFLGTLYGHFSREFAHLGKLHQELHSWNIFDPSDEAAQMNLMFIKLGINLITISAELVYYDHVRTHRYWNRLAPNMYAYQPSEEEKLWQQKFLGLVETSENEGSLHSENP